MLLSNSKGLFVEWVNKTIKSTKVVETFVKRNMIRKRKWKYINEDTKPVWIAHKVSIEFWIFLFFFHYRQHTILNMCITCLNLRKKNYYLLDYMSSLCQGVIKICIRLNNIKSIMLFFSCIWLINGFTYMIKRKKSKTKQNKVIIIITMNEQSWKGVASILDLTLTEIISWNSLVYLCIFVIYF